MNAFDILEQRGFFYQHTDEEATKKLLNAEGEAFYIGIDPTADSMHVGHLLPIMAARHLQRHGHRPVILIGGGTARVGDPSGKTEMRKMLSEQDIADNATALRQQVGRFLDFSDDDKGILVNNSDWLDGLGYIEFLRDVGKHFSVNRMLTAESVKQRLETGLSFLEFNYTLLQAYDFYVLRRDRNCRFQFGGQDQWGNIVAGIDLTRRMLSQEVYGATFPLLTNSQGQKFGKTVAGAVWLDLKRTSTTDYYQFWRNVEDTEVTKLLCFFTDLPVAEIQRLGALEAPAINRAKEILAFEATALAHGFQEAERVFHAIAGRFGFADPEGKIQTSSRIAQFRPESSTKDLPTYALGKAAAEAGIWICALFTESGLQTGNGAARRLIQGGGAYLNEERLTDVQRQVTLQDFQDGELVLRAGKKNLRRVVIE